MARYRGVTWDHPRGRLALEQAAAQVRTAEGEPLIEWHAQSLEGFESAPIADTAERYDVIVLDHPHLGDALAREALQPLDELYDTGWLEGLAAASVGRSLDAYRMDGHVWALPLDAATQVSVRLPERLPVMPRTWDDVEEASRSVRVALSLAGPHAYLTFSSMCVAMGAAPHTTAGRGYVDPAAGTEALRRMTQLAGRAPQGSEDLNPIGLLDRMRTARDIDLIPLVYGYVTYAQGPNTLAFGDAPTGPGGRTGSTLGGTGLALSARCDPDAVLLAHLRDLLGPEAQTRLLPRNSGQPSRRDAWLDPEVNASSAGFYRDTLATIEAAWVRPRVDGFIGFQAEASHRIREAVRGRTPANAALRELDELFDALAPALSERPFA